MPDPQITAAMEQLTAARTAQMVDTCTVTRTGEREQTPPLDADGNVTPAPAATVYVGRCTISDPGQARGAGPITVTDESGVPSARALKVPHTADLRPGDVLTVDSSAFSPGLVGDVFTVLGEDERSYATFRRYRLRGSSWLSTESGA